MLLFSKINGIDIFIRKYGGWDIDLLGYLSNQRCLGAVQNLYPHEVAHFNTEAWKYYYLVL